VVFCFCAILTLSACKASKGSGPESSSGTPAEQVAVLLDQGKIKEASDVIVRQEAFFAGSFGDPEVKAILDRLTGALEYKYSPVATEIMNKANAVEWPVSQARWGRVKAEMTALQIKMDDLNKIAAFKYPRYRPEVYNKAVTALKGKMDRIRADASSSFASFSLGSGQDFFAVYPIAVDAGAILEENKRIWSTALAGFSSAQADMFLATYGKSLPESARDDMAQRYFMSLCPKGKNADLKDILAAYKKCRAAGMNLKTIPGIKIAFLQVTSPDLIKDKALDFPINVKLDIPFDASKASMRQAFSHKAVKEADILILMNVAVAKAKRVVARNEKVRSTYVASYRKEDNPEYDIIKAELAAASSQYHAAESKETTSWASDLIVHFIEESQKDDMIEDTSKRLTALKEKMRTTPKYLSVPDYQPYAVSKAHMDLFKFATVNYYIIDKRKKVFFRDTFDVSQKSFFTVCYDLQDSDPNQQKFLQTAVLEEDVVRHELEPVVVNLSDLLGQYASRPSAWKKYASMGTIHRVVVADTSSAQLKHKDQTFEYDKYYDKRFDSVVVVRNLGSGLGSGFYVTEDMVLTNYHVVEENNYVKLKLFSGRETMGRVIARDARLDLALIEADVKQKPVCFYNKRTIPLGRTVEAIGHPNGLEFSIARGALSSIREMRPINYSASNDWVRYIQTDTDINGGNSGGPLFYGKYVIGVNDWGYSKMGDGRNAHGLNFAIHYSEVFSFLDDNGIKVCKGSK
jgi:S1-C subfamily serine protease